MRFPEPILIRNPSDLAAITESITTGITYHRVQARRTMAKASPRISAAIKLPNAPHFTTSLSARLHHAGQRRLGGHSCMAISTGSRKAYARIFNDSPYDKLRGYSNVQPRADPHQCRWLAGDGLCEERVRYDRHHRRVPELGRHQRSPPTSSPPIRGFMGCASPRISDESSLATCQGGGKPGFALRLRPGRPPPFCCRSGRSGRPWTFKIFSFRPDSYCNSFLICSRLRS